MPETLSKLMNSLSEADLTRLVIALAVAATVLVVAWAVRAFLRRRFRILAATPDKEFLEVPLEAFSRTASAFLILIAARAGLEVYGLEDAASLWATRITTVGFFWQAGAWVSIAAVSWIDHRRRETLAEDKAAAGSLGIIRFIVRVAVWAVVLLLTLDNLGVNITALVAGLGVGGIAVALAVQNVLGDLLASLSITLDRPFVIGDFLIIDEHMGTVEYIGIKSTRLRSLSGEQIVMSNGDLLASRVRNYGRMAERRVLFTLGVTYETPRDRLQELPSLLRSIVEEQPGVRFDRAHFARYGAFSLDFEIVYYVKSPDYGRYMDVQQAINFRIHEAFEQLGVGFAYPTQTVWVAGGAPAAAPTA